MGEARLGQITQQCEGALPHLRHSVLKQTIQESILYNTAWTEKKRKEILVIPAYTGKAGS